MILCSSGKNNISRVSEANELDIVLATRTYKIHIFEPTCKVLFIIWRGETNSTKAKGGNRDVIERYDTHKGDIRKIRPSGPG